jgi:two-component system chemotaxis sensor kinase CheA
MDAVKTAIESLGGRVELESQRGLGTTTTLVVPISAAIQRVLLLGVAGETVAVPIAKVERIVEVAVSAIERSARESFALVDGEPVLVIDLAERLGLSAATTRGAVPLVLAEVRDARLALRVDDLEGQQEIYVKPLPELLAGLRGLAGLTVLGDGRPIFLLDLNHVV